jgi:Cft2 family RNA processing exonuclease
VRRGLERCLLVSERETKKARTMLWGHLLYALSTSRGRLFSCSTLTLKFRHLEFFPSPQALLQTYSSKSPKLILAVPASLSHGPSRHLFTEFAAVPDNVVLLTGRGEEGTLGRILFNKWNYVQRGDDKWDKGKIGRNIMLDGMLKLKVLPSLIW